MSAHLASVETFRVILMAAEKGTQPKLKPNTFARYARHLRRAGLIERSPGNGPYRLTEQGAAVLPQVQRVAQQASKLHADLSVLITPMLMPERT